MSKIAVKLYIFTFIILICIPWLLWLSLKEHIHNVNYEKRELAQLPENIFFTDEWNDYINDNMPFRNNLITMNSYIDYYVFDNSINEKVVIGKDNWLFYDNVYDGNPMGQYRGEGLLTEKELEALSSKYILLNDKLAKEGIEFVVFIAPNKERIYYDKISHIYGEPSEQYIAKQLVDYLTENTDVRVVYPYEELMCAKNRGLYDIYYHTDTHWNRVGGYIGARCLLKELNVDIPDIYSEAMTINEMAQDGGDLAGMISLNYSLEKYEKEYEIEGYNTHNVKKLENDYFGIVRYKAENADSRKIFVIRDSFGTAMADVVASQFSEACMLYYKEYSYEDIMNENPDIVVYEMVERYIR